MSVAQVLGFLVQGSASSWWGLGSWVPSTLCGLCVCAPPGPGRWHLPWIRPRPVDFPGLPFLPSARQSHLPADPCFVPEVPRPRSLRLRKYVHE